MSRDFLSVSSILHAENSAAAAASCGGKSITHSQKDYLATLTA
jgi:hypothetical protein